MLDIWKTTLFYEGESVVYDGFKYVWPVKGYGMWLGLTSLLGIVVFQSVLDKRSSEKI